MKIDMFRSEGMESITLSAESDADRMDLARLVSAVPFSDDDLARLRNVGSDRPLAP